MNQVVYYQLAVATVGGTSHQIIKKNEGNKNVYGACNTLCECYDGGAVEKKTADYLRSKLEIYCLTLASNIAQYTKKS